MEIRELVFKSARLINLADGRVAVNETDDAKRYLVELLELLNAQPELEAGGAPEETAAKETPVPPG